MRGGQIGNTNASSNIFMWGDAIRRILLANDGVKLREAAQSLVSQAITGDVPALKEIGDRLDGKVKQVLVHEGNEDAPMQINMHAAPDLAQRIRGMIREVNVIDVEPEELQPAAQVSQRPHSALPTRQITVPGDKLTAYSESTAVIEP
jgi:hypothetical protein